MGKGPHCHFCGDPLDGYKEIRRGVFAHKPCPSCKRITISFHGPDYERATLQNEPETKLIRMAQTGDGRIKISPPPPAGQTINNLGVPGLMLEEIMFKEPGEREFTDFPLTDLDTNALAVVILRSYKNARGKHFHILLQAVGPFVRSMDLRDIWEEFFSENYKQYDAFLGALEIFFLENLNRLREYELGRANFKKFLTERFRMELKEGSFESWREKEEYEFVPFDEMEETQLFESDATPPELLEEDIDPIIRDWREKWEQGMDRKARLVYKYEPRIFTMKPYERSAVLKRFAGEYHMNPKTAKAWYNILYKYTKERLPKKLFPRLASQFK